MKSCGCDEAIQANADREAIKPLHMDRELYPTIYKAAKLIADDNGVALLSQYTSMEGDPIEIMVAQARELNDVNVDEVEMWLASLTPEQLKIVCIGDILDAARVGITIPSDVECFLDTLLDADLIEEVPTKTILGSLKLEDDQCIVSLCEDGTGVIVAQSDKLHEDNVLAESTAEDNGFNPNWDHDLTIGLYLLRIKPWSHEYQDGDYDVGIDVLECTPLWAAPTEEKSSDG